MLKRRVANFATFLFSFLKPNSVQNNFFPVFLPLFPAQKETEHRSIFFSFSFLKLLHFFKFTSFSFLFPFSQKMASYKASLYFSVPFLFKKMKEKLSFLFPEYRSNYPSSFFFEIQGEEEKGRKDFLFIFPFYFLFLS